MKRLYLFIIFINLCLVSYSQIIKGTILDKETKTPVAYAAVYFDGTSVASYTDANGSFRLDIKNNYLNAVNNKCIRILFCNVNDFSSRKGYSGLPGTKNL